MMRFHRHGVPFAVAALLATLLAAFNASAAEDLHPPIPIPFNLKEPGFVTLVIDKPDGTRIRNLVSETPFPAGDNIAWWDGLDDLGRDTDAASHSVYHVPGKLVEPGEYTVRGLVRPKVSVIYEFSPYTNGNPAWKTEDRGSEWLANHTAPSTVLFLPAGAAPKRAGKPASAEGQVLIGSWVSEGGSGLAWVDLNGHKLWGQMWLGGVWSAASQLARDEGDHPAHGVYAYAAASWHGDKYNGNVSELRLRELVTPDAADKAPKDKRFGTGEDRGVLDPTYKIPNAPKGPNNVDLSNPNGSMDLTGLAARNGIVVAALGPQGLLVFVDASAHKLIGTAEITDPRGLAFDRAGRLLALSGHQLLRFSLDANDPTKLPAPQVLVADGLEDPQYLCVGPDGVVYISDWGKSHQVKMFGDDGKPLRTIGHAGVPGVGPYDAQHMNHPSGLTLDSQGRLWVAENDKSPKRVSVWNTTDGSLNAAYYGPMCYGGAGTIDPVDKTRFFYQDEGGGIELKLDWDKGTSEPVSIYWRPAADQTGLQGRYVGGPPDYPLHHNGRTYLTNAYSASTNGRLSATICLLENGVAKTVAAAGRTIDAAGKLVPAFNDAAIRAKMPSDIDPQKTPLLFVWSDLNGNGKVDPEEVQFFKPSIVLQGNAKVTVVEFVSVQDDLSFAIARVGDQAIRLAPTGESPEGTPSYDLSKAQTLVHDVQRSASGGGGGQVLVARDGWTVTTTPPKPLPPQSLGAVHNGIPMWSYPSVWPGLDKSHISPVPDFPGELIGTTRVIGNPFDAPAPSDAGQLFAINANKGTIYVFTVDGLFVTTLFKDSRGASWNAPEARRGMDVNDLSLNEECFGPMLTETTDGKIYLQAGSTGPILRVDGLGKVHRLPDAKVTVTAEQLIAVQRWTQDAEAQRQAKSQKGPMTLDVAIQPAPLNIDGKLEDWAGAKWATIDERRIQVGSWGHRQTVTSAAITFAGDKLCLAIKTDDPNLLKNSGESLQNLFKTGGCIDLMLGTNPDASPSRATPVAGDERLLVTRVAGKTAAVLYRPVVPGTTTEPIAFSSPLRTIHFDRVDDVSGDVELATTIDKDDKGVLTMANYELAIPLKTLGFSPKADTSIRGDVGVLRGNGEQTLQRVYWSNKASGIVSDVPSEAELTPGLWGTFHFESH